MIFINSSSLKLEGEASKMGSKLAKWFIKNAQKDNSQKIGEDRLWGKRTSQECPVAE